MRREALVVGISLYEPSLPNLQAPVEDAEAIAECLKQYGDFNVTTLPGPNQQGHVAKSRVSRERLEAAIIELFKPPTQTSTNIPNTGLLFFSGHGLRKTKGISEGFLATSDVDLKDNWGISLRWLHDLLRASPVQQQIVWLDCCYSGEFMNFMDELKQADPGNLEQRDRCFIAASLDYKVAYETGGQGVLTKALLQALNPAKQEDTSITNLTLTLAVTAALEQGNQVPLCANSGNTITLTGRQANTHRAILTSQCPYKGLEPFDWQGDDPKYFYGRRALTDSLLDKVRTGNFLAVVGASGSGKSSVVRAGLMYELKQGERLAGSQNWLVYSCRPGKEPLRSLARIFVEPDTVELVAERSLHLLQQLEKDGAAYLVEMIAALPTSRVVLVIDQFEECFTLCNNHLERQQFFQCLLSTVERSAGKLCVILAMRADFLNKCFNYAGLAKKIEENLAIVRPLEARELQAVIVQPAKQLGVEVQPELVTQMITDVETSPGSLPLLQYTLKQLWEQRTVNLLTIAAYNRLGGIRRTLQEHADQVYASLETQERKAIARHIFLELTQLGEGTEDTRRQVTKQELMTDGDGRSLSSIEEVLRILSDARLIVTSELTEKSQNSNHIEVVDIVHETLIRHWNRLRQWIADSRVVLQQKRMIEAAAEEWLNHGKPKDTAYLLQGEKLRNAEEFLNHHATTIPLSQQAKDFICASQRDRTTRRLWTGGIATTVGIILMSMVVFSWQQILRQQYEHKQRQILNALVNQEVNPELWSEVQDLRLEAKQLSQQGEIEAALSRHRTILLYINLVRNHKNTQPKKVELDKNTIELFYRETEKEFVQAIYQKGLLKKLKSDLVSAQQTNQFGFETKGYFNQLDDQFPPGPVRTTYALLINANVEGDRGVKADFNNNGVLDSETEAALIPRKILEDVETLWRQYTGDRCGWFGLNDATQQPDCTELGGESLLSRVLISPSFYDYITPHLNQSNIAKPSSANQPESL
ncbi:MAG: caspase family protein [Oscillatoriales cyanobacterium C42_A2020_001]|nr:caspase family protein [Leptolyngbyaceae cyanobacterium C42_A2020_001]